MENKEEKELTLEDILQALIVIDSKVNFIYNTMLNVDTKIKEVEDTKETKEK